MSELRSKTVKIRKSRPCSWCGEKIEKGELAAYRAGSEDGDFWSVTEHIECFDAVVNTDAEYFDSGYTPYEQLRGVAMQDDPR